MIRFEKDRQKGSLTVEMLLFLIPFMLAFCTIINMARVVEAELIIHHAMTQTAKELSAYGYVLTKTNISKQMQDSNKKSKEFTNDVTKTIDSIQEFSSVIGDVDSSSWAEDVIGSGKAVEQNIEKYVNDPSLIAAGVFAVIKSKASSSVKTAVIGGLTKGSIKKQLALVSDDPNEYLENIGVVDGMDGLDFSKSKWITNESGKGNIDIVVTFKMKNQLFPMFDFGEHEYMLSVSTLMW